MKIIGFECFQGKSKKDGAAYTCLKYYVAKDINDESHQGLTAVESGYIFNFTKEQASRIKHLFSTGTEVMCLYNRRGNLYDVREISEK